VIAFALSVALSLTGGSILSTAHNNVSKQVQSSLNLVQSMFIIQSNEKCNIFYDWFIELLKDRHDFATHLPCFHHKKLKHHSQ